MPDKVFPILFIAGARFGEAILATGLYRRLETEIPNARFTVVAGASGAPLFADAPSLEQVIVSGETGLAGATRVWLAARNRRWGLVADFRGLGVSAFLRRRRRAVIHPGGAPVHAMIRMARALGIEDDLPPPFIHVSSRTEAAVRERMRGRGPILAIAPGASWVGKAWPPERFAGLAARLLGRDGPLHDGRLLVLGDARDREAGRAVKLAVSRDRILSEPGQFDALETFALLRHARLAIGNDSAATQLAAAAGAPTVALFGPSDERLSAPFGPNAHVLRGPRPFDAFLALDPHLDQAICHMHDLSVETVVEAAVRLLGETEASHG